MCAYVCVEKIQRVCGQVWAHAYVPSSLTHNAPMETLFLPRLIPQLRGKDREIERLTKQLDQADVVPSQQLKEAEAAMGA